MGPMGQGPMTGRAAGHCAGYPMPGFTNPVGVREFGGGRGWGRGRAGWRHRHWYQATGVPGWQRAWTGWPGYPSPFPGSFGPTISRQQELEVLKQQATYFEQALGDLRARIQEIEAPADGSKNT